MAGDWIKMRVLLAKDPKVISMADHLAEQREFMDWLGDPFQTRCRESAHERVTRHVTVSVVIAALLQIWGVANDCGDVDGDDLVLPHAWIDQLDDVGGVPGMGDSMEHVGWVEQEGDDGEGDKLLNPRLRFPKFLKMNVPAEDRKKMQDAARQQRRRDKVKDEQRASRDASRDFVTTEERRVEEKIKTTTTPTDLQLQVFSFDPAEGGVQRGKKSRPSRRVPADFALTDELRAFALEKGLREPALSEEWEKFRDYEYRDSKTNWAGCWRTWVRNALEIRGRRPSAPGARVAAPSTHAEDYLRRKGEIG